MIYKGKYLIGILYIQWIDFTRNLVAQILVTFIVNWCDFYPNKRLNA